MGDPFREGMRAQQRKREKTIAREYTPIVLWVKTRFGRPGEVESYLRDEAKALPGVEVPDSYDEPGAEVSTAYDDEIEAEQEQESDD